MKITKRPSDIDIPDWLVESNIKFCKQENLYIEQYLLIRGLYLEKYKPNFMNVNDFIKQHNHIDYCEAIIREDGMIENASPSHETAIILAYPLMNEEDYYLSTYNLTEFTGYISVYYDIINAPTYITKEQLNTLKLLIDSGCVSNSINKIIERIKIIG